MLMRLTAWVKMNLVVIKVSSSFRSARTRALQYLEAYLRSPVSDPYALSIITYALTLANSTMASRALQHLNRLATSKGLTAAVLLWSLFYAIY